MGGAKAATGAVGVLDLRVLCHWVLRGHMGYAALTCLTGRSSSQSECLIDSHCV